MANSISNGETREFFIPDLCATKPVLILFIMAELMVLVFVLGDSNLPSISWGDLALNSMFVQWIVLLCAGILCAARSVLAQLSLTLGVLLSFLTILLVTLFSSWVALSVFGDTVYAYARMDNWWMLRNVLVAALLGGIALRYFYLQQQLRIQEQAELNARIDALRARIRPHFLFNTMNSIASLISSRPREAERVVEDMCELFRASLVEGDHETSLADELHLCRLYLQIEQLRLGDRLQVDWQLDETLLQTPLPALLLQPLVENAVYHGVALMPAGGRICIGVEARDGDVLVRVTNPVPEDDRHADGGHQIALLNIRQRLEALYDGAARLDVQPGDALHVVELRIPGKRER